MSPIGRARIDDGSFHDRNKVSNKAKNSGLPAENNVTDSTQRDDIKRGPCSRGNWLKTVPLYIGLFTCSMIALLVSMDRRVNPYDEGIVLVGALRVLAGDVIHRDFYANYGPAQFYILSQLFLLFSTKVIVERGWDIAIRAATTVLCYSFVAPVVGRRLGLAAYSGSLVWLARFGFAGYPVFPTLLLALLSFFLLLPVYRGKISISGTLASGFVAGTAALFRYDVGIAIAAVELCIACAFLALPAGLFRRERWKQLTKLTVFYVIGFSILTLPVVTAYFLLRAIDDFWFDVVRFPMEHYRAMRSLPFPRMRPSFSAVYETAVYLPPVTWIPVLFWLVLARRHGLRLPNISPPADCKYCTWFLVNLLALSAVFFVKGMVRISPIHMAMSIVTSMVLIMVVVGLGDLKCKTLRLTSVASLIVAGFFTAVAGFGVLAHTEVNLRWLKDEGLNSASRPYGSCYPPPGLERIACLEFDHSALDAVLFVETATRSDDFLFVGAGRHDKLFANNISFYFLAKRMPATKWYHFDPGLQTSTPIQRQIVAELQTKRPVIIVLDKTYDSYLEPNRSSESSHVEILDDYIRAQYVRVGSFGKIDVLRRLVESN